MVNGRKWNICEELFVAMPACFPVIFVSDYKDTLGDYLFYGRVVYPLQSGPSAGLLDNKGYVFGRIAETVGVIGNRPVESVVFRDLHNETFENIRSPFYTRFRFLFILQFGV